LAVACAARQTPAPIEYLLRKAGLSQDKTTLSSGLCDFTSQPTTQLSDDGHEARRLQLRRPAAVRAAHSAATPSTGHLLGADFLISSNNFHESCSRFQAPIRRSSSTSDVPTHSLSLYRSELRAKLRIDRTPEALL